MIRRSLTLINRLGLHARAASRLVQVAAGYESKVWLERDERRVNAKSIMGVLMLAAPIGTSLTLECDGPDEELAAAAIEQLVRDRFGEEE